jgi:ATP-binding cassette subfamily B protein RaxB
MNDPAGLLHFSGRKRLPVIRQSEVTECGIACLAMVAGYHGRKVDLHWFRTRLTSSTMGLTLKDLVGLAEKMGMSARPLKLDLDHLHKLQRPCILHWGLNHFVVFKGYRNGKVVVHDPATGEVVHSTDAVSKHFTGVALELAPSANFEVRDERTKFRLSHLWNRITGLKPALIQLLGLSVLVQIFILASPFYMQLVVDEVLTKMDTDLLVVLALGFGLLMLANEAAKAIRAYVILYVSNKLGFQIVSNLFSHLLRLPMRWYERRHVGDILSRFSSTRPIQELFSEGLVAAFIDGLMAISTLVLIFVYSKLLGTVVVLATALYLLLRLGFYRPLRQKNEEQIVTAANEQTTFIESIRGIQSIKIFGREADRRSLWQNRYADVINSGVRVGKLKIGFSVGNGLLFGLENTAVVYLGALQVLNGQLTVGMFFAFMAYKKYFVDNSINLVERLIEFKLLDLHLDRIGDIGLAAPERGLDELRRGSPVPLSGGVKPAFELENVSFRYGDTDPWILDGATLSINAGEMISIVGPSGSGKTTLMKLILGLFEPESGRIEFAGEPLARLDKSAFRKRVGTVMQDDTLFAGSIAENIAFFDPGPDQEKIHRCAQMAYIDRDIQAMPMRYESLVGDMGASLSAGQRQRILLARALYREPGILMLDEGTANLDAVTESNVVRMLNVLDSIRICVAHREHMIAASDRVVMLHGGRIHEIDKNQMIVHHGQAATVSNPLPAT